MDNFRALLDDYRYCCTINNKYNSNNTKTNNYNYNTTNNYTNNYNFNNNTYNYNNNNYYYNYNFINNNYNYTNNYNNYNNNDNNNYTNITILIDLWIMMAIKKTSHVRRDSYIKRLKGHVTFESLGLQ